MKPFSLFFADIDVKGLLDSPKGPSDYSWLIMLGALLGVIAIATIWAVVYSQKRKRHKSRNHHRELPKKVATTTHDPAQPEARSKKGKKWKKPRRPHRPLNPTLAQTRGLPPMRDENTPLPPMP